MIQIDKIHLNVALSSSCLTNSFVLDLYKLWTQAQ